MFLADKELLFEQFDQSACTCADKYSRFVYMFRHGQLCLEKVWLRFINYALDQFARSADHTVLADLQIGHISQRMSINCCTIN